MFFRKMVELVSFLLKKREMWHSYSYLNELNRLQILSIVLVCSEIDIQYSKYIACYSKSYTRAVFEWDDIRLELEQNHLISA